MKRRSILSLNAICRGAKILGPHPWIITKLVRLQLEKWLFPKTIPGADEGYGNRIHQLSIRITDLCNLRCHTCGQWGDSGFMHGRDLRLHRQQEIAADRYLEIFDDLVASGHRPNVYVWGGEPMMYSEVMRVIRGATAHRLPVSIATNGHLLEQHAEQFVDTPLFLLQVSIDGHSQAIHDQARPAAGRVSAYDNVVAGLRRVHEEKVKKAKGLPLVASLTVVSKSNMDHLVEIYETFAPYVDVFVFYLSWWIDEENAVAHERDFCSRFGFEPKLHRGWIGNWRPENLQALSAQLKQLKHCSRRLGAPAVTILPDITEESALEEYYTNHRADFGFKECISIYQVAELDSNGDLSPCRDYHDYVVGNIRDQTVTELWNSESFRQFRRSLHTRGLMPVCRRCCGLMGY